MVAMTNTARTVDRRRLAALAAALAIALLAPPAALGGGLEREAAPVGPRWSNEHHVPGISVATGCRDRADYVAGRDAWGRPVAPADLPSLSPNTPPLIVDVEVDVPRRQAGNGGGRQATVHVPVDLAAGALASKGMRPQDCIPAVK